jgi:hypothetical protein
MTELLPFSRATHPSLESLIELPFMEKNDARIASGQLSCLEYGHRCP